LSSAGTPISSAGTPIPAASRPLRADAARNRAKVLLAARETFADEGLEADMASIAARAGVGVGTVYRHFPTKAALLTALTEAHFERLGEISEGAAAQGGDAWEAVERMVWDSAEYSAGDHGMCEVLARAPAEARDMPAARRLRELTAGLVENAKAEGSMRSDAGPDDIPMIMCGFGRIAAIQQAGGSVDWRRYLRLTLDGLRAR
jgi:AcrR family transcriptional regulator